ncbi:MAG TPA: pyruvate kinase, partial [Ktedonobacteraceae bacterium]|nr:pyruvate kinase [Ktedonobacteraceae bacterium]
MRRTKIVCTIGPSTSSEERLEELMRAGMNVARLNFSHGTHDEHAAVIERVRAISARIECAVAILQDLQGPKIRTGALENGQPVRLVDGATLTITTRPIAGNAQIVSTTYTQLPLDVKPGDRILLDDGLMELCVVDANENEVHCQVVHGGTLKEHKGINLLGVAVSAPALTEKDRDDLRFGLLHRVDYVALSFVRKPEDILEAKAFIRAVLSEQGTSRPAKQAYLPPPLIAKLEKPEAVARLDEI